MDWDKPARPCLLVSPDILAEGQLPEVFAGRESQAAEIALSLRPILECGKPVNCWLHGKPGAGKTATAKLMLQKIAGESTVRGVYVNCWENPTYFSVLECIAKELRMLGAERLSTAFKLERLKRHLARERVVVVLDEIDQPAPRERNTILYNLSDIPSMGLVCVCNSQHVYFSLEDRVKSRLNPLRIPFEEYSPADIFQILSLRAEHALAPEACSQKLLRLIAELSQGDARVAIQTLKNAAYRAEKRNGSEIAEEDVRRAWNSSKDLKKTYLLRNLTDHHRLLHELVARMPGILSGDLWRLYLKTCATRRIRPIAVRTYSDYCNKLAVLGLIDARRAAIQGKIRVFSPMR